MYLFVYKTTHINGRYYIGRHQTKRLDDGYLGSGKWISGIRDKSSLTREILAEASSKEELCKLEEHYISLHYDDLNCMNMKIGSDGSTSEDAKRFARKMVENGTHNFLGGEIQRNRVANGTHHFLGGEIQRKTNARRITDKTHNLIGKNNPTHERIRNGTYHMLGEKNPSHARVKNGTHNFLGPESNKKRIEDGTHNFLGPNAPSQVKWICEMCGKSGKGKGAFTKWHGSNCKRKK